MNLPNADEHCSKVDVAGGGWVWCCLCNMEVASRNGWPFTLVRWLEHKSNKSHCMKMKLADLKRKPECDLDRFEQSRVKNERKTQFGLASFFFGKKKNSATDMSKSCANPSSDVAVGTADTTSNAAAAAGSVLLTAPSTGVSSMTRNLTSCQGIVADYSGRMKDNLTAFSVHASIQGTSTYTFGFAGQSHFPQLYSKICTGSKSTL
jgi:hypothetical protein